MRRSQLLVVGATVLTTLTGLVTPAAAGGGDGPTGDPIVVMTVSDTTQPNGNTSPEFAGAVQARAEYINENGGINGSPVEVIECDSGVDPNKTLACAREAVENDVVAIIGALINFEDQFYPLMEENGIPVIGSSPASLTGYTNPMSFPITPGIVGYFMGLPQELALAGVTKFSMMMADLGPAVPFAEQLVEGGAAIAGIEFTGNTVIPPDATDLAPLVASATSDGEDGMVSWIPGEGYNALLQQLQASGFDGVNSTVISATSAQTLSEVGDASEGLYATSAFSPPTAKNKAMNQFRRDMNAYDSDLVLNELSQHFWASMWIFERVAADLPEVTAAATLAGMGELQGFKMGGMMPALTTTQPFAELPQGIPPLPRLFAPDVSFLQLRDGKLVRAERDYLFFNPFTNEPVNT